MYIFLDFDGVLRRLSSEPSRLEQQCIDYFESAIRPFPDIKIVISSTWRLAMPLRELRQPFSSEVANKIIGVTPEVTTPTEYARYDEIQFYLRRNGMSEAWLAIDDDRDHFPHNAPLLLTDPNVGFDSNCLARLWEWVMSNDA